MRNPNLSRARQKGRGRRNRGVGCRHSGRSGGLASRCVGVPILTPQGLQQSGDKARELQRHQREVGIHAHHRILGLQASPGPFLEQVRESQAGQREVLSQEAGESLCLGKAHCHHQLAGLHGGSNRVRGPAGVRAGPSGPQGWKANARRRLCSSSEDRLKGESRRYSRMLLNHMVVPGEKAGIMDKTPATGQHFGTGRPSLFPKGLWIKLFYFAVSAQRTSRRAAAPAPDTTRWGPEDRRIRASTPMAWLPPRPRGSGGLASVPIRCT
jgi:hypothetical protein